MTFRQFYGITENNKKIEEDVILMSKTFKKIYLSFFALSSIIVFGGASCIHASSPSNAIPPSLKEEDNYTYDDFDEEGESTDAVSENPGNGCLANEDSDDEQSDNEDPIDEGFVINVERSISILYRCGYFNSLRKGPVVMCAEDFCEVVRTFECRNLSADERLDGGRVVFLGAKCSGSNSEMEKIKCLCYRRSLFEKGCNVSAVEGIFQENFGHNHLSNRLCCVMNPRRLIDCVLAKHKVPKCAFIGFCFHCERYLKCVWDGTCVLQGDDSYNPNQDLILCNESLFLNSKIGSKYVDDFKDISKYGLNYEKYTGLQCASFMGWLGNCLGETFAGIRRFESEAYINGLRCWDYAVKWSDISVEPDCLKSQNLTL